MFFSVVTLIQLYSNRINEVNKFHISFSVSSILAILSDHMFFEPLWSQLSVLHFFRVRVGG